MTAEVRMRPGKERLLAACVTHADALVKLAEWCAVGRPDGVMVNFYPRVRDSIVDLYRAPESRESDIERLLQARSQSEYRQVLLRLAARAQ